MFFGTRVPIQTFLDDIAAGDSLEDFLADLPSVSRDLAVQFLQSANDTLIASGRLTA